MKIRLFVVLMMVAGLADAKESGQDWNTTTLSDATIENVQKAQYSYKRCVADEMNKSDHLSLDSRHATDAIIKQCEPTLAEMRNVYTQAGVPGAVADRHLKTLRIRVTRNLLQELMYREAAKKAGGS
ncbi:hypothetical protein [Methylomonas sp. MgM2]